MNVKEPAAQAVAIRGLVFLALSLVVFLAGCEFRSPPPESEAEPESAAEPEAALSEPEPEAMPRVFFITPEDGATVSNPIAFQFGSEDFRISPVPVAVEQAREATGHYHLGIDADCLLVGVVIPKADPWVHLDDGSATFGGADFETALQPGEHRFALQIGDDEHRTLEGLCATITVIVE